MPSAVSRIRVGDRDAGVDEAGVLAALRIQLAAYKLPKRIHFVDELPRNAMGKVQKNLIRDRLAAGASDG